MGHKVSSIALGITALHCLTAHTARTTPSHPLFSQDCRSHSSWAYNKTCAQKSEFSRSSSLFFSLHCPHSAHRTGRVTAHALYSQNPPHVPIGKAVNKLDREFGNRHLSRNVRSTSISRGPQPQEKKQIFVQLVSSPGAMRKRAMLITNWSNDFHVLMNRLLLE